MRKTLYMHISETSVFACLKGNTPTPAYAMHTFPPGVFGNTEAMALSAKEDEDFYKNFRLLRKGLLPPVYIPVADINRTVIRMTPLPEAAVPGKFRPRLTAKDKWKLVEGAFPLGELMNEETHIFDGYIQGSQFFMAALPLNIAGTLAQFCALLIGGTWKIKRLETIEHLLFRRLMNEPDHKRQWFLFPQKENLRVLTITDGVPEAVTNLPTLAEIKNGALYRLWQGQTLEKVTLLTRPDWVQAWCRDEEWLRSFLAVEDIICETEPFFV